MSTTDMRETADRLLNERFRHADRAEISASANGATVEIYQDHDPEHRGDPVLTAFFPVMDDDDPTTGVSRVTVAELCGFHGERRQAEVEACAELWSVMNREVMEWVTDPDVPDFMQ